MKRVIVALDFSQAKKALDFVAQLDPNQCRVKVGKELFTNAGPDLIKALHERGFEVFLDLKFHDIPATTAKAVKAAADLGVWMVNVHASGGKEMMQAAAAALHQYGQAAPKLIAVTVLTSMDENELALVGVERSLNKHVESLASLAQECGLDGIVCSAQEAIMLREALGPDFLLVTPGIRPAGSDYNDQKRVMTPGEASEVGVDYLVVGRPIREADNPQLALQEINRQLLN